MENIYLYLYIVLCVKSCKEAKHLIIMLASTAKEKHLILHKIYPLPFTKPQSVIHMKAFTRNHYPFPFSYP